jgi:O-antigen ligase
VNKTLAGRTLRQITGLAWLLFLVTLPVTNFPFFPGGVGGATLIRPLSVYPLIVLIVLVTLPRLFTRPLPRTVLPLLAFIAVGLMSSLLSLTFGPETYRGVSTYSRILRNLVTLGLGAAFYLTVILYVQSWDDLKGSLRWLYLGFAVALLWGSLQAVYIVHFSRGYFDWLNQIQSFIANRRLFSTRISGMTYEPKWFAEQISYLLFPWLVGSILTKRSLFKRRLGPISIEWVLLVWGAVVMLFTFSRTGFLILGVIAFVSLLFYRWPRKNREDKVSPEKAKPGRWKKVAQASLVVVILAGMLLAIGSQNKYFSRFWRYWTDDRRPTNKTYFEYIAVSQRVAYWVTAYRMFEAYPVLGVGLGNYAFYFDQMLPEQPWDRLPEIIRQLTPVEGRTRLITPKNLYARLLAETGLVGTITFTAFVAAILGCSLSLWLSSSPERKYWGLSGLLGMLVFTIALFSFDSFAIPNTWIVFGIITAAAHLPGPEGSSAEAGAPAGAEGEASAPSLSQPSGLAP